MALTVNQILDNPSVPLSAADTYLPDQLIADPKSIVTMPATIAAGANLARGSVLGKVTASGKYILSKTGAVDGSQTPAAILVDQANAASADVQGGIYVAGEFNLNALIYDNSFTATTVQAGLAAAKIWAKPPVSAADPN